jgi:hypothetical protein
MGCAVSIHINNCDDYNSENIRRINEINRRHKD